MKEKTILSYIERCNDAVSKKMTRNAYAITHDLSAGYFYNTWNNINSEFQKGNISVDLFNKVVEALTKLDSSYAIYSQDGVKFGEEGNEDYTSIERDNEGKITFYAFRVGRKNKTPLVGKLSRDDMDTICRLYTYYGQSLTRREISRYFPEWSLNDFKRILSIWGLTKDSAPLAQHTIEEHTTEELLEIQARNKENDFMKKAEQQRIKATEKLLAKVQQENYELKQRYNNKIEILKELKSENAYNFYKDIEAPGEKYNVGIVVISDLHVGAYNTKNGYLPLEDYNEAEIRRRLTKILQFAVNSDWTDIIIINLGDGIDSYKKETTRGGHELPTIMNDKEIAHLYQKLMMEFFQSLHKEFSSIKYYCVGESNHPGDWGWINDVLLAEKLDPMGIECYISDDPILNFNINNISVTALHGKNNQTQYKGFPLVLNDKTTNWFNNYFLDSTFNFKKKKVVIKGDLHQYAVTKAQSFDYISMPSIYGSSQYIVSNFGKTRWGCGYMTINEDNYSSGVIED